MERTESIQFYFLISVKAIGYINLLSIYLHIVHFQLARRIKNEQKLV